MNLSAIQEVLQKAGIDAWLFADHHSRDPLAARILQLSQSEICSRRWYYLLPAEGEPRKLLHRIEPKALAALPGLVFHYSSWREQEDGVRRLLSGCPKVAMQYSRHGTLLNVSIADAGVVELVRELGHEVLSSAELIQRLFSALSPKQCEQHYEAGRRIDAILREAFALIGREYGKIREAEVGEFILNRFADSELLTEHGPVVAVKNHSGDPHYEPRKGADFLIEAGDLVLIDLWGKLKEDGAPYYDITWVASLGEPEPIVQEVFSTVTAARDLAVRFIQERVRSGVPVSGYEVDRQVRDFITKAGWGPRFLHRTGHSIDTSIHGAGANIDDFESRDERRLLSGSCFSIEPGIYLEDFGVRSEINMIVNEQDAIVTGEIQREILRLL